MKLAKSLMRLVIVTAVTATSSLVLASVSTSDETCAFEIELARFESTLSTREGARRYAVAAPDFQMDELVILDATAEEASTWKTDDGFFRAALPRLARISRNPESKTLATVDYTDEAQDFGTALVPSSAIRPARNWNRYGLTGAIREWHLKKLKFEPGETVRFRDERTLEMRAGIFVTQNPKRSGENRGKSEIRLATGASIFTRSNYVYKKVSGYAVSTPKIRPVPNLPWPESGASNDAIAFILSEAGHLTSRAGFLELPEKERLIAVQRFIRAIMTYDPVLSEKLSDFRNQGHPDFRTRIKDGIGDSRHLADLSMKILGEAGYRPDLFLLIKDGNFKHAWVQVLVDNGTGTRVPWIFDASLEYVAQWSETVDAKVAIYTDTARVLAVPGDL